MSNLTTLHCPNCGAPVDSNDQRCDYCGSLLLVSQPAELALPAIAQAQEIAAQMRERLALNPYDGDAYYQLGLATFTLGRYDQAQNAFAQAQHYLPGSAVASYFKGLAMLFGLQDDILGVSNFRLHEIEREFETATQLDPNLHVAASYLDFLRGLKLRNQDQYADAIAPLTQAAAALPDFGIIHKALAACYFQVNDLHAAIQSAKRALELRPTDIDLTYLLGVAYTRLQKLNEMEEYAHRVAVLRGDKRNWNRVVREFNGQFD
jgi:tetratricopeptide (TPR) repeat protein